MAAFARAQQPTSVVPLPPRDTVPPSVVPMPEQDTTPPVTPFPEIPDSLRRPPITPRRAFLMSLLLPGSAQARLNRPKASMLFAVAEILCIGMTRKSGQDLREARSAPKDSIIAGYVINPTT